MHLTKSIGKFFDKKARGQKLQSCKGVIDKKGKKRKIWFESFERFRSGQMKAVVSLACIPAI